MTKLFLTPAEYKTLTESNALTDQKRAEAKLAWQVKHNKVPKPYDQFERYAFYRRCFSEAEALRLTRQDTWILGLPDLMHRKTSDYPMPWYLRLWLVTSGIEIDLHPATQAEADKQAASVRFWRNYGIVSALIIASMWFSILTSPKHHEQAPQQQPTHRNVVLGLPKTA